MQYESFLPQPRMDVTNNQMERNDERLTLGVKHGRIPCLFAAVDMYPSLAMCAVHLGPDMIFCVPHPPHPTAHRTAQHGEAICPLAHTSSPCVEKDESVVVSWETFEGLTQLVAALV